MFKNSAYLMAPLFIALTTPAFAYAASDTDINELREQIQQMEKRLQKSESAAANSGTEKVSRAASTDNAFNPAISLILSGTYGSYSQNHEDAKITGFGLSPNNHGYKKSFNLGESELGISANIDPQFRGVATFALEAGGGLGVENAYVQSSALGNGLNLKMGRFFSGLGYLNEQHAHYWDFVDQPLVYNTFWNKQMNEDGLQLKWLAPTNTYFELGAEVGRGRSHPGTDRKDNNGAGATTFYAHLGDDIGASHSWRAGASLHQTRRVAAEADAFDVKNKFSGDSQTAGVDFVWKYAPNGNSTVTNFKLQGEYFQRKESGLLTYDSAEGGTNVTGNYSVTQSGWYLQSVYQFMPRWRTGLRYDQLNSGNAEVAAALSNVPASYQFVPTRTTLMFDYSPSEFSRLRLQLSQDKSRENLSDNMLFMQYVMSLGAHGGHRF